MFGVGRAELAGGMHLLARIAQSERGGRSSRGPSAVEDVNVLMESVRAHLRRLLNARHGMSQCVADYGLPAISDLSVDVGDYVKAMQDAIATTIERYEPRLRRVRVTRVVDEHEGRSLTFRVDAVMVGKSSEHRVYYETSLGGGGQFDVEG